MINISNADLLTRRQLPEFVNQNPNNSSLLAFRGELSEITKHKSPDLMEAIAIRKWCRAQQIGGWSRDDNSSENPKILLTRQRCGVPGSCRRFAYVFAAALLAGGLDSRIVNVGEGIYDSSANHTLVEVWIRELHKWVLMDSMYNTMFLVDEKPASLIELYGVISSHNWERVRFERSGSVTEPHPTLNVNFRQLFHHLFYPMTNALFDGYRVSLFARKRIAVTHFTAPGGESYPEFLKEGLLCCSLLLLTVGCTCTVLSILAYIGLLKR